MCSDFHVSKHLAAEAVHIKTKVTGEKEEILII